MNYLTLINQFWQLRREVPFSSTESDLHFYLLNVSNGLKWKNPFQQTNALICATLNVSEKTLIAARNRLKQYGLIDFVAGVKRSPSSYRLLLLENTLENIQGKIQGIREECDSESDSVFDSVFDSVSGGNAPDIYKHKQEVNETKLKPNPTPAADAAAREEKKIGELVSPLVSAPAESPAATEKKGSKAAGHVGTRIAVLLPTETLLADLLNPGGDAERVQLLAQPLTMEQADKLLTDYDEISVRAIFLQMANWQPLLNKATSANLTARNWLAKRAESSSSTPTTHVNASSYQRSANGAKPTGNAGQLARALAGNPRLSNVSAGNC